MARDDFRKKRDKDTVDDGIKTKLVTTRRVSKVVKGGRNSSFAALVVAGDGKGRVGIGKVLLRPAPEGRGVIAGGSVRAVLELCGINNITTKCYGSRNPINVVKATMNALESLRTLDEVAAARGKSVSDIL